MQTMVCSRSGLCKLWSVLGVVYANCGLCRNAKKCRHSEVRPACVFVTGNYRCTNSSKMPP